MSTSTSSRPTDRNLLFGILALQMDFIGRDALIAAMQAWVFDKAKSLGQILQEQGALSGEQRALLEALVQEHLRLHDNDPEKSLAAVSSIGSVREDLKQIADADVQASLVHVSAALLPENDPYGTKPAVGTPTSAGLRFRILRPHAKGGLGQVSVALDEELNREVALKEIQDRHADDPHNRSRFLLEAEITGGLEHPGIVPVYGLGQYADGRPFYAMRFIKGDNLKEAIRRFHEADQPGRDPGERSLALRQLLRRFIDVCNAVAYAHSRGVLHRDLKPGNIMLGKYGETLIIDWGLAKAVGARLARSASESIEERTLRPSSGSGIAATQMGSVVGTPGYMSPEQATGNLDLLGPASDVYSLGATLYALLAGQAPFPERDMVDVLEKVRNGDFPRPSHIKKGVPPALEAVCLKAMALRPENRYPSPRALADDIEHWLADEPVSAWPEPLSDRARRWLTRHRTTATTALAALIVGLVSLAVAIAVLAAANERERVARLHAQRKETETLLSKYVAQINLAQREWEQANVGRVLELLDELRPKRPEDKDLRGWEWYYLDRLCQGNLQTLRGHTQAVVGVAFSPDGRRLASASHDKTIMVWDSTSCEKLLTLTGHTDRVRAVAFSPDGQRLASASSDRTIKLWDSTSGQELLTLHGHSSSVLGVAFSPDGRRLASVGHDDTVRIWDSASGKELRTQKGHTSGVLDDNQAPVLGVAFSPDGQLLASACLGQTVRVWNSTTGQELLRLKGHEWMVLGVAFSPDGRRLASASEDGTVRVWDSTSGQELLTLKGHTGGVLAVAFSPDSTRVASVSGDRTIKVWGSTRGHELLTLKGHTDSVTAVAFSPDGRRLASASWDETLKLWDSTSGQESLTLWRRWGMIMQLAFSPDSRRLAMAGPDDTIRIWDNTSGQQLLRLKGHTSPVYDVVFSPDGRRLASASDDGTVKVWDNTSGRELLTLIGHTGPASIVFSPDGRRLASSMTRYKNAAYETSERDKSIRVWDSTNGQELLTLRGFTPLMFSPDGRRLTSASDDNIVRVWDSTSGRELLTLKGHTGRVTAVVFSPDGLRLASASDDNVARIWDSTSGQEQLTLNGFPRVAFSPDGRLLISSGEDKGKVWDSISGEELWTLKGHMWKFHDIVFSPDGRRLAEAVDEKTVKVWDSTTGQELLTLKSTANVEALAFSPNGHQLAYSGLDGAVNVWDATPVTPEVRDRREARGLVAFLAEADQFLPREEMLARIKKDSTISEAVRKEALSTAEHHQYEADPYQIEQGRLYLMRYPSAPAATYQIALRFAEAALRRDPEDGSCFSILGIAQYRLGQHEDAVKTLTRANHLLVKASGSSHPVDLAFLAMAYHQLGQKDQAGELWKRLQEFVKDPSWANSEEVHSSVLEADEVLHGPANKSKK